MYWTDNLTHVAYISWSLKSSIVEDGRRLEPQPATAWYLHLVDVETREDKVIYVSYDGNPPCVLDIVAESDEYKDRSKTKPPVRAPGATPGSGGKPYPGSDSTQYGTGDGTSVSSK
jgi:hypothetical protein